MAKTGSHLRIEEMGENVLGVRLKGDHRTPEPIHFRLVFPGGCIDLVRASDGDYWAHLIINHPEDGGDPYRQMARISNARLDIANNAYQDVNIGDFNNPNLYHLAVRVTPVGRENND
jgi:hypothetical protein